MPALFAILREHREKFSVEPARELDAGWVFLNEVGKLETSGTLVKAWTHCAKAAGVVGNVTVHGMRRTINDLVRRGGVDAVVTKSITGHVTEEMREHYSSVALDEKRKAITAVYGLVQTSPGGGEVGDRVGDDGSGRLAS